MVEPLSTQLGTGQRLPLIGLGTWNVVAEAVLPTVRVAIETGYRHIDTAYGYDNEAEIGAALQQVGVDRAELFVTSKIPPRRIGFEEQTLAGSLAKLRTDYLDLWLIHAYPETPERSVRLWDFLIRAREQGRVRAIGVSSYSTAQIDHLVRETGVVPAVNQIRWTPEIFDRERQRQLRQRGIALEGFSAIRLTDLGDPSLVKVAAAHDVSPAQVLLRWHIEHGAVALPRSVRPERIRENFDVWDFRLRDDEVALIDAMSTVI